MSALLQRWSDGLARTGEAHFAARLQKLSAFGLIIFGFTSSFAVIDWVMSLNPLWYSTIYAAMVTVGELLGAFALVVLLVSLLANREPLARATTPQLLNDLGSLLLAFVMLWAYLAFSQSLLIWSGNLSEEIPGYLARIRNGWEWVAVAIVLLHFVLPFGLLVLRDVKRHASTLAFAAGLLLVMRAVDTYWLIAPDAGYAQVQIHWLDPVVFVAIGGFWTALVARNLAQRPLVPADLPVLQRQAQLEQEAV